MKRTFLALWLLWFLAFAFIEGYAVGHPQAGDTLSELLWGLMELEWLKFLLGCAWGWLGWHLFVQRPKEKA